MGRNAYLFLVCNRSTNGQATKILEYVPTITPIIIAKAKRLITSPPNNQSIRTTIKVVIEVTIVLLKESLILLSITSE